MQELNVPSDVYDAFRALNTDISLLALPLRLEEGILRPLTVVQCKDADSSHQVSLNLLNDILSPTRPLYLLLRRSDSIFAITFVPYRAPQNEREAYLHYRHDLVKLLGEGKIKTNLVCKEIAEITDARSWAERDRHQGEDADANHLGACDISHRDSSGGIADLGYMRNKCRLCDRRMKNKITEEALAALGRLEEEGMLLRISLDTSLVLTLEREATTVQPEAVSSYIPVTHPTFTLYRHPNKRLYFIFHSPDSAPVQERMKTTMAIPGLVNIHAEDCGVHIDQKIEIHEPEDLAFEEGDGNVGKFRSMYLRGEWQGTESQYDGLDRDREFYDAVR